MPLLRFAYVLALAVWLGGMIVLGAVVAPALFSTLGALDPVSGRVFAGEGFGAVLRRFHYVAYAAGGVLLVTLSAMALLGPRPRSFAIRTAIVAVMVAVAAYSGVLVLGEIDTIQSEIAAVSPPPPQDGGASVAAATVAAAHPLPSSLPANDARRIRFDQLHVLSTRLMMFNIVAGLVLLVWEARDSSR
jgi:uncharacterized membrane protein